MWCHINNVIYHTIPVKISIECQFSPINGVIQFFYRFISLKILIRFLVVGFTGVYLFQTRL